MFIAWVHFAALYLLTGALIRFFTLKFPDNPFSQALIFAH
jgi:hypothetical protein